MAHYAFLNYNNVVTEVIVGKDEGEGIDWEVEYGNFRGQTCKRISYNTIANTHTDNGTPFRGNYAGIGFTYDTENDVFYGPKPYESWIINQTTWVWEAPIPYPDDGNIYNWNEETTSWDLK